MKKIKSTTLITILYYVFRLFPISSKKVVLSNYVGKGYGCNPKYLAIELLKRNKGWKLVWLTENIESDFPKEIVVVQQDTIKAIFESATAKVWIDNQRKLPHHKKRKDQIFIETWHGGGGPIKKIGADNPSNIGNMPYYNTSLHMDKIVDVMISNSTCCSQIYRSAFLYHGEILECGYPRNDILVDKWKQGKERKKVYSFYKLDNNVKTVLYAPTYRNKRDLEPYSLDLDAVCKVLKERFSGEWKICIRLHPSMQKKALELTSGENIINVSNYDDMQELLAASDVLISDYSSVISEFALTHKPIFLYSTDIESYAKERAFYCDYRKLPFPLAETNSEMLVNIRNFNKKDYLDRVNDYMSEIGMMEKGNAAEQVVDWLEKRCSKS